MQFISKIFKYFGNLTPKEQIYSFGPSTLSELLKQFDLPKKEKTNEDIIRDYKVKETLAALEVDMLKLDPPICFKGSHIFIDNDSKKFFDWVPCVLRPEIVYCSYGKN